MIRNVLKGTGGPETGLFQGGDHVPLAGLDIALEDLAEFLFCPGPAVELIDGFQAGKGMSRKQMRDNFDAILADFAAIPVSQEEKVRVGVVGEIYVKFSPLGNNNLEDFLLSEGAEPVVPGLTDFMRVLLLYTLVPASSFSCLARALALASISLIRFSWLILVAPGS